MPQMFLKVHCCVKKVKLVYCHLVTIFIHTFEHWTTSCSKPHKYVQCILRFICVYRWDKIVHWTKYRDGSSRQLWSKTIWLVINVSTKVLLWIHRFGSTSIECHTFYKKHRSSTIQYLRSLRMITMRLSRYISRYVVWREVILLLLLDAKQP